MILEGRKVLMFFNNAYGFGYKNFEIRISGSKGIIFYDDLEGLKISKENKQPLEKVSVGDYLKHIQVGSSLVSKSFKFFAHDLVEYLKGNKKKLEYCTLEEAKENLEYLEKIDKE